ncbi:hypothetical protein H9P43_007060 [Blastocladiella emersonii ATCC 22665]|nr:hypothetical protein H9P43_007060 [Blastocladiella emersonii ATCC 22665]
MPNNTMLLATLAVLALLAQASAAYWREVDTQLSITGMVHGPFDYATTGRCVDFSERSANGMSAKAQLWACSVKWDGSASPHDHKIGFETASGWAWIKHRHNGVDYCLDVAEGKAYAGAPVRWWKCNDTKAQAWYLTGKGGRGEIRSDLDYNLCLDPDNGFNGDRNGQALKLWHCHGGREQEFGIGKMSTNGMFDMERECRAKADWQTSCRIECKKDPKWKNFFYDGVTYSCGHPYGLNANPVCVSSLAPWDHGHDFSGDDRQTCNCACRWSGGGGGAVSQSVIGGKDRVAESVGGGKDRVAESAGEDKNQGKPRVYPLIGTVRATKAATQQAAAPTLVVSGRP